MSYNPQNPNGQATSANSSPVVIASDQSNVPVVISNTAAVSVSVSNTPTVAASQSGTWSVTNPGTFAVQAQQSGTWAVNSTLWNTNFVFSSGNSTSVNLAAGATFTGAIENVTDQQNISIIASCDQPLTITVKQYQDASGTKLIASWVYTSPASTPFARSLALNGNYVQVVVQNTGASTTTSIVVDTAYGTLPIVTQNGNIPIALNEIGGVAFSASGSFADAESNTQTTLPTEAYTMVFNGTTWDRMRGDATNGLYTISRRQLVRLSASVTGVTTATTAYTAGDQVGSIINLSGAARASGGSGTIVSVVLVDQSDIAGAYDVVFFRQSVTLAADNAAFAISDADSLQTVGLVQLAGAFDIGNNRLIQAYNLAVPYDCNGSTSLYAALITRVGHTFFTAGALPQLVVYAEQN